MDIHLNQTNSVGRLSQVGSVGTDVASEMVRQETGRKLMDKPSLTVSRMKSQEVERVPSDKELSRDDDLGKLVNFAFGLPAPTSPDFQ